MKRFIISWVIAAASLYLVSLLLGPRMEFEGILPVVWTALLVGLLNAIVAPVVRLLTCPAYLLTLGLFRFVVSAAFLLLARSVVHGFWIAGFWWAVLASILISVSTTILGGLVKKEED